MERGESTSLTVYSILVDRQNLQNERQVWQEHATKSFGNKRTRSLSRSRSLGKTRKSSYPQPPAGTFDFLAERTLLGHQTIPSVVHATTNSSMIPTQTVSTGGRATRSFGSACPRLHSKSHGHSKSVGTTSDGPGYRRRESVSSALRRAKSTATGLCVGADGASTPPDALDTFTEKSNTKVVTLSNRPQGTTSPGSVVLISPTTDQDRASPERGLLVPSHQRFGVSPSPSSQTQSVEGVGIAISSPQPSEGQSNDDPITLPAHPYAQGVNNHRAPVNSTPQLTGVVHHRQLIVHPYATHPAHPGTLSPQWAHRDQTVSPAGGMFAEVVPEHLREVRPEEIQYSPYVEDPPRVVTTAHAVGRPEAAERQSADLLSRRDSDVLRMDDALTSSLVRDRLSSSTDSGVGASEDPHPYGPQPERTPWGRLNTFPIRQVHELLSAANDNRGEGTSHHQWLEPPPILPRTVNGNFDPTSPRIASPGQVNPSAPSDTQTAVRRIASTGSSPGLSNNSSPPLTPRPLDRLDDLERFQDLFYNPTPTRPQSFGSPPVAVPATEPEDRFSASPVNLTSGGSQLTTLVRQLSEDLYELRNEEPILEDDGRLDGQNDGQSGDPLTSVGSPSTQNGSPPALGVTYSFLSNLSPRHPLDRPVASSRQNFPEDVESELSSLSDRIPEEDYIEITGSYSYPPRSTEIEWSLKKPYVSASLKRSPPHLPSVAHVAYRVCLFD